MSYITISPDAKYISGILAKFASNTIGIRLGNTGTGQRPHYQVQYDNRPPIAFRNNHTYFWKNDHQRTFKEDNLYSVIPKEFFEMLLTTGSGAVMTSNAGEVAVIKKNEYSEGAVKKALVKFYERNLKARAACINYHKPICKICEMDFWKTYGDIGKGFIHVHHIIPIHKIGKKYNLDPINDLIPVCPNCHAMLHRKKDSTISAEELRGLISSQKVLNDT